MSQLHAWSLVLCAVVLALLVASHFFGVLVDHLGERRDRGRRELLAAVSDWCAQAPPLRTIRNGKVNPKPAGPQPPAPVQTPRPMPPRQPNPPCKARRGTSSGRTGR